MVFLGWRCAYFPREMAMSKSDGLTEDELILTITSPGSAFGVWLAVCLLCQWFNKIS